MPPARPKRPAAKGRPKQRPAQRQAPVEEPTLQLDDDHAIAILEKAVEYEVIDEDKVPENKRQRINAAAEQIDLLIEAWTQGGINPFSDNEEKAEMGAAIQDILELGGVSIDEDGEVTYGDLPELEEGEAEEEGDEDDNEGGDGEAAVDINDIIDGYEDLSAASRVKAIKALELDPDDDDDYNKLVGIYEWEEAQETPSSRVCNYLDEILPQDGEGGEEEGEEGESAEEGDEEAEGGDEESWEGAAQPWLKSEGAPSDYSKMDAVAVKKHLDKLLAKDELTAEMLDYVDGYEQNATGKPPRKRILDHVKKLYDQVPEGDGGGEEEEAEEEAPRAGRPTAARSGRSARKEPEEEPEGGSLFIVSAEGAEDTTCYGPLQAAGAVGDLLMQGFTEVAVVAG